MNLRTIDHLPSCTPTSLTWGRFMKVRRLDLKSMSLQHYSASYFVSLSDHRWTFHSERLQPADFDGSPVNHLTELQSVSPQQLTQPYRYSSEPLALHLDPPLGPLSVSPQVSSCAETHDRTGVKRHNSFTRDFKHVPKQNCHPEGGKSSRNLMQGQFLLFVGCSDVLHWWKSYIMWFTHSQLYFSLYFLWVKDGN